MNPKHNRSSAQHLHKRMGWNSDAQARRARTSSNVVALSAASLVVPLVLMLAFPMLNSYVDQLWNAERWHEGPPAPAAIWICEALTCASFGAVLAGHALALARHRNMRRACTLAWGSFAVAAIVAIVLALGVYRISAADIPSPYEVHFQAGALGAYLTLAIALTASAHKAKRVAKKPPIPRQSDPR